MCGNLQRLARSEWRSIYHTLFLVQEQRLRRNGLALIVWFIITGFLCSTPYPWFAAYYSLLSQKNDSGWRPRQFSIKIGQKWPFQNICKPIFSRLHSDYVPHIMRCFEIGKPYQIKRLIRVIEKHFQVLFKYFSYSSVKISCLFVYCFTFAITNHVEKHQ